MQPTLHTRDGWKVDSYLLQTGDVEPAVYRRSEDGPAIDYLRLVRPRTVITCVECHTRPEIRDGLLFAHEREA